MATELTVEVNIMPRIVFVGDSQTCGCVGAWDYPQMLSWEMPLRVFNRAVGGSNTSHLLGEFSGGTVTVKKGEKLVVGEGTSWFAGPYIGMTLRLGTQEYTLDHIETTDYAKRNCNAVLTEPAREDFSGTNYQFEAGWRVRVAEVKPQYACFMYSVNDAGRTSEDFKSKLAEILRRCKEAGLQPLFLSGVPMMDAAAGGSHPGSVERSATRAQDLLEFCQAEGLPYGDVLRTLRRLDGHHTAEWVDTIHPTTDGSLPALWALRTLLGELGVASNPYYLRGYRAVGDTLPDLRLGSAPRPGELIPIHTSQPRYNEKNEMSEAGFTLEARRVCDEYGLLAEADGQTLHSDKPLVLQLGVGELKHLTGATLEVVATTPVHVHLCDWATGKWQELGSGQERLSLPLTAAQLKTAWHAGAVWVGLTGAGLEVDYAGLKLTGDLKPFTPQAQAGPLLWPRPGEFDWTSEGNLLPNGTFEQAAAGAPVGWQATAEGATYLPAGVVMQGKGEFTGKRLERFKVLETKLPGSVRPLDSVYVAAGPTGGTGRFLIAAVPTPEEFVLRRMPKEAAPVDFEVRRESGCLGVPGGCSVEARGTAGWEVQTEALPAGTYTLSFFCRAYDPAGMTAKARPGAAAAVQICGEDGQVLGHMTDLDCTYLWQRGYLTVTLAKAGKLTVRLQAAEGKTVQYTGVRLGA